MYVVLIPVPLHMLCSGCASKLDHNPREDDDEVMGDGNGCGATEAVAYALSYDSPSSPPT